MKNEKLAQHIFSKLWNVSAEDFRVIFEKYEGGIEEVEPKVEVPKERDLTGVRFRYKKEMQIYTIESKDSLNYIISWIDEDGIKDDTTHTHSGVDKNFKNGYWIEVKEETLIEQPTTPHTIQEQINALEDRLAALELQYEAPTLKRNLSTDNTEQEYLTPQQQFEINKGIKKWDWNELQDDWKKVECLSYDDIKYFIEGYHTTLEKIIKLKLCK